MPGSSSFRLRADRADAAYDLRIPGGFSASAATPEAPLPDQAVPVLSTANVDFGAVAVTDPAAPFSLVHDCPVDHAPAAST